MKPSAKSFVQVGDVLLGKYRVERVLGEGGMGIVVAARHVHLNELFAIKMMLPAATTQHDAVERFLREARASARLRGEHVARVHDVGSLESGTPYMLMEYLDGIDLKACVKKQGAFAIEEAALYVYQACEAVAEAHANGIVHRDLKPANLFLTRRPNGSPCIKVLDFGISKELDSAGNSGFDLTKTGTFIGSPSYMSPEQMANIKATDMRSDIWSLGVILYELVTATLPFTATVMTELVAKVLTSAPQPPSRYRPDLPPAFEAVVMRCLEKQPAQRFSTVVELMQALQPFTMGQLVQTLPGGMRAPVASTPAPRAQFPSFVAVAPPAGPALAGHGATPSVPPPGVVAQASADMDARRSLAAIGQGAFGEGQVPADRGQISASVQGQTHGAWGNTSKVESQKKTVVIVAAAVLGVGALIGMGISLSSGPTSATSETPMAAPSAGASQPDENARVSVAAVQPVPVAPSASASADVTAPASTDDAGDTTAKASPPKKTDTSSGNTVRTKPTGPSKKKIDIPGFND
ncbi:MAG: protein kinase [Polyangiaceae bacterium]|nr:protein kinase [Polyangiaceae bacterium]